MFKLRGFGLFNRNTISLPGTPPNLAEALASTNICKLKFSCFSFFMMLKNINKARRGNEHKHAL